MSCEKNERHYAFFQNKECEAFPCHCGIPKESFNCLFCYCPLYALGDNCGGKFSYTENGTKDCSDCLFPHWKGNYDKLMERFPDVAKLAARCKD